jgi:hypothetical protein
MENETPDRYGETVNLGPLFSCQGALEDAASARPDVSLPVRIANADHLATLMADRGWIPLRAANGLRSGILLLQSVDKPVRDADADQVRGRFHEAGIALSAYPRGVVRISLPAVVWGPETARHITCVFGAVAGLFRQDRQTLWPAFRRRPGPLYKRLPSSLGRSNAATGFPSASSR